MIFFTKTKGASLIVALGVMSVLLILGSSISALISKSSRTTANIESANKAYFAAEAGLEDALYDLSNHLSGYQASDNVTLTNNSKYEWDIVYRTDSNNTIPIPGEGNSPINSDWNALTYKGTYNLDLFYDTNDGASVTDYDCSDSCDIVNLSSIADFKLYVRTPTGETLTTDDVYISWTISGVDKSDTTKKFTLIPLGSGANVSEISGIKINNSVIVDNLVLNENSWGIEISESGTIEKTITQFLNNASLHMPKLKLSGVAELLDNIGDPFPYLECQLVVDDTIADSFATITSEGYMAGVKQSIQTKIKQQGAISLFDYAVFQ